MMTRRHHSVLVLDPWARSSLAACRALGRRAEYRVGTAGHAPGGLGAGPAAHSRFSSRYDELPDPAGPAREFGEALARIVERRGYDVVIATLDPTLARLSGIELPVPSIPDVGPAYHALADKVRLAELCARADVAYPYTVAPDGLDEDRSVVAAVSLPAVVKSSRSAEADPARVTAARGARLCRTPEAVGSAIDAIRAAGLRPIVQSRVRSDLKVNAVVVRDQRDSRFRYAHRVLRESPPSGGIGVALETIPAESGVGEEAVAALESVCSAAGYSGLAQAEFCRSADDGRLYLVDVNPRLWGSTWFAERLGQRVVEQAVHQALGLAPVEHPPYEIGRRFHTPIGELRWLAEQPSKAVGFRRILRTTRPWDVFEFIDPRDPVPIALYGLLALRPQLRGTIPGDAM